MHHYGAANKVDVVSIAPSSYHEHGDLVGNVILQEGRVVVEEGAKANAVYIEATAEQITSQAAVVSADNTDAPNVPIILWDTQYSAAEDSANQSSIPSPSTNNVIILSNKVTADDGTVSNDGVIYLQNAKKAYSTIQAGFDAMADGERAFLLQDCVSSTAFTMEKASGSYSFDLNGHSITWNSYTGADTIYKFGLYLANSSSYSLINGTLVNNSNAYSGVVYVDGEDHSVLSFDLNSVTVKNNDGASNIFGGVVIDCVQEASVKGCDVSVKKGYGVQIDGGKISIANTSVSSDAVDNAASGRSSAILCGEGAEMAVRDCVATATNIALHVPTSGGTISVYGGTFSGAKAIQLDNDKDSTTWDGLPNYENGSFAIVYGGEFNGILKENINPSRGVAKIYVYGGSFDNDPTSYLGEQYAASKSGSVWTVQSK